MARFALLLLCLSTSAMAQDIAWPGGVARIDLGPASGEAPIVEYNDRRVLVAKKEGRWQAIIGVNLDWHTHKIFLMVNRSRPGCISETRVGQRRGVICRY